jgi:hypothetical protein
MSIYQSIKKVGRRCLNFLNEQKFQKKANSNYPALKKSWMEKTSIFLSQKGLKIRLHASVRKLLQPVGVRV